MNLTIKRNDDLKVQESRESGEKPKRIYVDGSKMNVSSSAHANAKSSSTSAKVYKVSQIKDYIRKDGIVVSGHERVHTINNDSMEGSASTPGIFISGKKPDKVILRIRDKEKDEQYNPFFDKYKSYEELNRSEAYGEDYTIDTKKRHSDFSIIAPHGGNTEPGTSELAKAIADNGGHSFYSMNSHKELDNTDLHLTSAKFDEPKAVDIASRSKYNITIHGTKDDENAVYLGGQNEKLGKLIENELKSNGFDVKRHTSKYLQGISKSNIANKGKGLDGGVQLELSRGLRQRMFDDISSEKSRSATKTKHFTKFVNAVKSALGKYKG